MLITFHSKAVAEVLMLAKHAEPLLQAAGKSFEEKNVPEQGVFTVEQLPAAIQGLKHAIAQAQAPQEAPQEPDEDAEPIPPMAMPVGPAQRAYPLLDMMQRSLDAGVGVTWELSRGW